MTKKISERVLEKIISLITHRLPKNRYGDYISSLLLFLKQHRRFPKREGGDLNDALFAIKTSDEIINPLRVFVSDKHHLKQYVKATVGDEYNVPIETVLYSLQEARSYDFPKDCVIKPTHMSGEVMFRRAGSPVNFNRISRWFESNFYNWTREANYKTLKPKVIVEPFIFGIDNCEDYKIFCVDGEPKFLWVDLERQGEQRRNLYTTDWDLLPVCIRFPQGEAVPRPANLEEMLDIARKLSREFSLIRVDLYSDGDRVLVGELTNCSGRACSRLKPADKAPIVTDLLFGSGEPSFS